jgi:RNase P/RNase MRP subunit p29
MPIYFHGWRRKLGVLTLVLACIFIGGWLRGLCAHDLIDTGRYIRGRHGIVIDSNGNSLKIMTRSGEAICLDHTGAINTINMDTSDVHVFLAGIVTVPYWSIVIPLTLLSAYLLLSKPRKPTLDCPPEISATR